MPKIIKPLKHDAYAHFEVDTKGYKPHHMVNTNFYEHKVAIRQHYESIDAKVDNPAGHYVPNNMQSSLQGDKPNPAFNLIDPYTMGDYYDVEFFERDDTQITGAVDIAEFFAGDLYLFGKAKDESYGGTCQYCGTKQAFIAHKDGVIEGHINDEGFFSAEPGKCCGIHPIEIEIDVPTGELVFFEHINDRMFDDILQIDTTKHYGKVRACKFFQEKNMAFCFLGDESPDVLQMYDDSIQVRGELYYSDEEVYEQYARYSREILYSDEWPSMEKKIAAYQKEFGSFTKIGYCTSNSKLYTVCDESTLRKVYQEYTDEEYPEKWNMIDVRVTVAPGKYRVTVYADAFHPVDKPWRWASRYSLDSRSIDAIITRIGDIDANV